MTMDRTAFHKHFKSPGPVVLPVVHVLDTKRSLQNLDIAIGEGAPGAFLINHDFGIEPFLEIIRDVRVRYPSYWLGVNFLAVTGRDGFPRLAELASEGCYVDGYWGDDARIDETREKQPEAQAIQDARNGWDGLYFGGTAFKKQRPVAEKDYATAAKTARDWMDVVTTSGIATGEEADDAKVTTFRQAIGAAPLALASGVTPENAHRYRDVDCFMVATGVNLEGNFYDLDPSRLARLLKRCREFGQE